MQTPLHVLLFHSWLECDEYEQSSVQLKLLSADHPLTLVLLRKGSRSRGKSIDQVVELWRRYTKSWAKWYPADLAAYQKGPEPGARPRPGIHYPGIIYGETWGYRREEAVCPSQYGPPEEEHLLLYQCIQAWLKSQAPVADGEYTSPINIIGTVKIADDGEREGLPYGIHNLQHQRSHSRHYDDHVSQHDDDADCCPERYAVDIPLDNDSISISIAAACEQTDVDSDPTADKASSANSDHHPGIASQVEAAVSDEYTSSRQEDHEQADTDQAVVHSRVSDDSEDGEDVPSDYGMELDQSCCYLKDVVMSCTLTEVQGILSRFRQDQAHKQLQTFKDELLLRSISNMDNTVVESPI